MSAQHQPVFELMKARARLEYLEQELSIAVHLLYGVLTWILTIAPTELQQRISMVVRSKIFQLPQGSYIGQRLIELDKQFGGLLEEKGIWLERWVYEPREGKDG